MSLVVVSVVVVVGVVGGWGQLVACGTLIAAFVVRRAMTALSPLTAVLPRSCDATFTWPGPLWSLGEIIVTTGTTPSEPVNQRHARPSPRHIYYRKLG